jgi:beta-aspartyl-peptidase (threonine type)
MVRNAESPLAARQQRAMICIVVVASVAFGAVAGCRTAGPRRMEQSIAQVLERQARNWNAGDVEAFMGAYWNSDALTFSSSGRVHRGWEETLERYRARYPTNADMGKLTFSDLEVTPLGRDSALVLGRWHLQREKPVGGVFTLVMRKQDGRWMIIHDHTSAADLP